MNVNEQAQIAREIRSSTISALEKKRKRLISLSLTIASALSVAMLFWAMKYKSELTYTQKELEATKNALEQCKRSLDSN